MRPKAPSRATTEDKFVYVAFALGAIAFVGVIAIGLFIALSVNTFVRWGELTSAQDELSGLHKLCGDAVCAAGEILVEGDGCFTCVAYPGQSTAFYTPDIPATANVNSIVLFAVSQVTTALAPTSPFTSLQRVDVSGYVYFKVNDPSADYIFLALTIIPPPGSGTSYTSGGSLGCVDAITGLTAVGLPRITLDYGTPSFSMNMIMTPNPGWNTLNTITCYIDATTVTAGPT